MYLSFHPQYRKWLQLHLNFLSVDHKNLWLKELIRTETTKNMNEFHEEKEDNKGKKTKLLFIHGEQRTVEHVNKAYNNVLSCIIMAIEEPEKSTTLQVC